jgi:hypothetical protein
MANEQNQVKWQEGQYTLERLQEEGYKENDFAIVTLKTQQEFRKERTAKPEKLKSLLIEIERMEEYHMNVTPYFLHGWRSKQYKNGYGGEQISYSNMLKVEHASSPCQK